ncbi:calcium-binding protein [Phormidium tenue FACHB-886]|nr:calcium-binding protein [Phormidium tenue FACHB-886]
MARQVSEIEPNGSAPIAAPIGLVDRSGVVLKGKLDSSDLTDVHRFRVDSSSQVSLSMTPTGSNANLRLFHIELGGTIPRTLGSSIEAGTLTETVQHEHLTPGEYFVQVSKPLGDTAATNYTLSMTATPITRAELSITTGRVTTLDQFDTRIPLTNSHRADFYAHFGTPPFLIVGGLPEERKAVADQDDVVLNQKETRQYNVNQRKHDGRFSIEDSDPLDAFTFDDSADIHRDPRFSGFSFSYDVVTRLITDKETESILGQVGQLIKTEGDGRGSNRSLKRAKAEFRFEYETFVQTSGGVDNDGTAPPPVIKGTNSSQTIVGRNIGGIIDGRGGRDNISGMGGDDVLLGGNGNDILNGGVGNDLTFGGNGQDIHISGVGCDTFVADLDATTTDLFKDFNLRQGDRIGLAFGLTFEAIDVVAHRQGTALKFGNDTLAVLSNVTPNQLNANHFQQIDFSTIQGIEIPYAVA